jgi:hypothetical protein
VLGIWYWREDSIAVRQQVAKCGSGGARMTPDRCEWAWVMRWAMLASRLGEPGSCATLQ